MSELAEISQEQAYLFISDVHLGGFEPEKNLDIEKDLISMIDYADAMEMNIIILGDLFDYWMEYPDYIPQMAQPVLKRFDHLHKKKPGTLFITGNHDNWTDGFFKKTGFEVEPEYRILQLEDKRVFLMHGDGLKNRYLNFPRPLFHRIIRNSYFVAMYKKLLPAKSGLAVMRRYSRLNRKLKSFFNVSNHHLDTWAENWLHAGKTEVVICGHHHKPIFETFGNKVYMNLGNFFDDRTAGIYANKCFHLVTWDGSSKTFSTRKSTTFPINDE